MRNVGERPGTALRTLVVALLAGAALSCGGLEGAVWVRPVHTESVVYATVDGRPATGFLARPEEGVEGAPGILVIPESWGLNERIRALAQGLAGAGYVALAVDLYAGEVAVDPVRAAELMSAAAGREAQLEDNLRQAHTYLVQQIGHSRIGVIGSRFGGGWSLRTALALDDGIAATVMYDGQPMTDRDALARLQSPVLGHFGRRQGGIPIDSVHEFERLMRELGKTAEIHIHDGAEGAFALPSGTGRDAQAGGEAWPLTLAFFERHLRASVVSQKFAYEEERRNRRNSAETSVLLNGRTSDSRD